MSSHENGQACCGTGCGTHGLGDPVFLERLCVSAVRLFVASLLMLSVGLDAIGPLVVLVVVIALVIWIYLRQGRNEVLEYLVAQTNFSPPLTFRGTLVVEEYKPGSFLRLGNRATAARRLQWQYRWFGVGRQAIFDEVVFDRSRTTIELNRKDKRTTANFSEFSAIRMREVGGGRGGFLWHIELVPHRGAPRPFVSSEHGDRRATFKNAAPLAKAASMIMAVPVHVFVAGNVWTPGWPPKSPSLPTPD
jgi:hypothetical protein